MARLLTLKALIGKGSRVGRVGQKTFREINTCRIKNFKITSPPAPLAFKEFQAYFRDIRLREKTDS